MYTADEHYGPILGTTQPTATPTPDHPAGTPERTIRTIPRSTGLNDNPLLFLFVLVAAAVLLLRVNVHGSIGGSVSA
jgi:hypothetical protein